MLHSSEHVYSGLTQDSGISVVTTNTTDKMVVGTVSDTTTARARSKALPPTRPRYLCPQNW